ncbi:MAG: molecular chaperone DnaJ [Candidatus Omnitrophica bacterium]|nr:molecular chaperone DnaJ [Candidatus Omnitrophota bacterium]
MKRDYYETLGISKTVGDEEIRSAYRKLAMKYHPDKHQGEKQAEEKFKEISEAYEVLSDENKKATYDRFGHEGLKGAFGAGGFQWQNFTHAEDISDLFGGIADALGGFGFDELFGFGNTRRRQGRGPRRGQDIEHEITVKFEEAALGMDKTVEIKRYDNCSSCKGTGASLGTKDTVCQHCHGRGQVSVTSGFFSIARTCPSCGGSGRVIKDPCKDCQGTGRERVKKKIKIKIPAGMDNGMRLRVTQEGDAGDKGGPRGDLYVAVHVEKHPFFKRHDNDIYGEIKISFTQAIFGSSIQVPTLEGKTYMKIPAGTPSGKVFKLDGKGTPAIMSGGAHGDEYIKVTVDVPKRLSAEQERILKEFANTLDEKPVKKPKGIMDKVKKAFR